MSRMPIERMQNALEQAKTISEEDYAKVKAIANIVRPLRSIIQKTPDDHGMTEWRDIYFPSDDGTPLDGWYIPAKGGWQWRRSELSVAPAAVARRRKNVDGGADDIGRSAT
jgi:hypothetical protein